MTAAISILAAMVSVLVFLTARWQAVVATEKLRYELYDRRFAIYMAFHEMLVAVIEKQDIDVELRKANAARAHGPFLLDADLIAFLKILHDEAFRINSLTYLMQNKTLYAPPEHAERVSQLAHDKLVLVKRIDELARQFERFLRLRDLACFDFVAGGISWVQSAAQQFGKRVNSIR